MRLKRSEGQAQFEVFGRWVNVRWDGWLPFSQRNGFITVWRVPLLGWHVTAGRVKHL